MTFLKSFMIALALSFMAVAPHAAEAVKAPLSLSSTEPVDVRADRTEFRSKENLVLFSGQVVAVRANMTINSDEMTVKLNPDTREVTEVTALGNVSVRRDDVLATGKRAVYLVVADTVTLTGEPKIWRGADAVLGDEVVIHLAEERLEVKGGARVILNPASRKKDEAK